MTVIERTLKRALLTDQRETTLNFCFLVVTFAIIIVSDVVETPSN
jgi:hypothetical protein